MSADFAETERWTFWGGPACGESQTRVAAALAPADPDAAPAEHLRLIPAFDPARQRTVVQVHRYLAAPWPPATDTTGPYWRYVGMSVEEHPGQL